jgi:pimeloyl-ACP methyl ester carboxylesterase
VDRFTSFDGTTIAYDRWAGERGPVLLHHGFAANAAVNWIAPGIVDRLTGAGFEVVALDARAHGRSDKPRDPARYGDDAMAHDVRSLLDHLGWGEVDLVGYSMGSIVSLTVAVEEPRVRSLVLGGVGEGALGTLSVLPSDVVDALEDESAGDRAPLARAFRAFADSTGADRHALAALVRGRLRRVLPVDRVTAPTLVVVGVDDVLARHPERLAEAIAGARLVQVPGDHLSAVFQPELAGAIVGFLEEVP